MDAGSSLLDASIGTSPLSPLIRDFILDGLERWDSVSQSVSQLVDRWFETRVEETAQYSFFSSDRTNDLPSFVRSLVRSSLMIFFSSLFLGRQTDRQTDSLSLSRLGLRKDIKLIREAREEGKTRLKYN